MAYPWCKVCSTFFVYMYFYLTKVILCKIPKKRPTLPQFFMCVCNHVCNQPIDS